MLLPAVMAQSLKRKHFLVTVASITALLLKLQIVLSSALFQTTTMTITRPSEIHLADSFAVRSLDDVGDDFEIDPSGNARYAGAVRATAEGIRNFGLQPPFGASDICAYQTFYPASGEGDSSSQRATVNSPLTAVVDGLFMETECLKAEDISLSQPDGETIDFSIKFEGCNTILRKTWKNQRPNQWTNRGAWDSPRVEENDKPCPSLPQKHPQRLFFTFDAACHVEMNNTTIAECTVAGAVLCAGYSFVSEVQVVDDGIKPSVISINGLGSRTPFNMDPWAILETQREGALSTSGIENAPDLSVQLGLDAWPLDLYSGVVLNGTDDFSVLFNSTTLDEAAKFVFAYLGPMTSHTYSRNPEDSWSGGTLAQQEITLQVNLAACTAAIALAATCLCGALFALSCPRNLAKPGHRDPMTLMGLAVFVQSKTQSRGSLHEDPPADFMSTASKLAWSHCDFTPLVQRLWTRGLFLVFVSGLAVSLGIALGRSRDNDGLAVVPKDGYISASWQSVPALVMLIISLYSASLAVSVRSLSVITQLSKKPCYAAEFDETPLDMLGVPALIYSWRHSMPAATLLQSVAMICAFLPIMSSGLFTPEPVPGRQKVTIQQESWFVDSGEIDTRELAHSSAREVVRTLNLIKSRSSLTFPDNTYANLLFPSFTINDGVWGSSRSASMVLPAARLTPSCERLDADEFDFVNTTDNTLNFRRNATCPGTGGVLSYGAPISHSIPETLYLGCVAESHRDAAFSLDERCRNSTNRDNEQEAPWKLYTYIWGKMRNASLPGGDAFDHLAVWECNYTWTEVATTLNVVYSNGSTSIDHDDPPVVDGSDAHASWEPTFGVPHLPPVRPPYEYRGTPAGETIDGVFPEIPLHEYLARQFRLLMRPFGPMDVEDLGNPAKDDQMLETLHSDLAFSLAQLANIEKRSSLDESVVVPSEHRSIRPFNATLVDSQQYRLVQDEGVTIAIVTILCLVVLIHASAILSELYPRLPQSWALVVGRGNVAPPRFNTVGMMDVLLRDSNVGQVLSPHAHRMSEQELRQHLDGTQFQVGFFHSVVDHLDVYTLGALNDENFVFKGAGLDVDARNSTPDSNVH